MRTLRPLLPPSAATTTRCRPEARARSWHHMPGCASSCYSTTWTDQSSPWLTLCWYSCPHPDSNNNTILFSENYPLAKVSLFSVFETKLKGQRQRLQGLHQFHNVKLESILFNDQILFFDLYLLGNAIQNQFWYLKNFALSMILKKRDNENDMIPVCWQRWAARLPWAPSPGRAWQARYRTRQDGPCYCCLPQI